MTFTGSKEHLVKDWRAIGSAKLTKQDKKYLQDRAISQEVASLNNLRSLTAEQTARIWPWLKYPALVFPFSKDYAQLRLFGAPHDKRFKNISGMGLRLYKPVLPKSFRMTMEDALAAKKNPRKLVIGEGPTRALAAISAGMLAVAVAGSWNWQQQRQVLPELKRIQFRKRVVEPLFDADIEDNAHVLLAFLLFGDWLDSRHAQVKFVQIPRVRGAKTGLDDYLHKHGKQKFKKLARVDWRSADGRLAELRTLVERKTEGGLADLFLMHYREEVRYDEEDETWYVWNELRWHRQKRQAPKVLNRFRRTIRWLLKQASLTTNRDTAKRYLRWAQQCDSKRVMVGARDLAAAEPAIAVQTNQLDADPHLLGTQSGILDIRTCELVEAQQEQMITRAVAVPFDPDAKCDRWRRFVKEVMAGDADMVAFMRRLGGYLLLGGNPERQMFFLYGVGRNGKSIFIEVLRRLFGDYAHPFKSTGLMKSRADRDAESAQPFLLKLQGARLIAAAEIEEGAELNGSMVKDLTGNDELTVRGLHSAPVTFTIIGKILVRCNHRPIVSGSDQAIWDRIVEIPFERRFTDEEQDKTLLETLTAELSGILNWAMEGFKDYQDGGLRVPDKVKRQTTSYRDAMNNVLSWLEQSTKKDVKAKTDVGAAYGNYCEWCELNSEQNALVFSQSKAKFNATLKAEGYQVASLHGGRVWRGLGMLK